VGQPPHFLLVCDHGICGGRLDRVALLPWLPEQRGWGTAQGPAIRLFAMQGDNRGHDPKWLVSAWTGPDEPDLRREAIEIGCPEPQCSRPAYRSDAAKFQTLLTTITTDDQLRAAVTITADDTVIVMRLDALHSARKYAKARGASV
jgi:hypothetical protein